VNKTIKYISQAVFNSYAILFFSQNQILGGLLLIVSFFNLNAGIAGLISVMLSIAITSGLGYSRQSIRMGFYSFNSLLLGIGLGTFYQLNCSFFLWLIIAGLITTMLSVVLAAILGKNNYPILSVPFIIVFWLLLSAANSIYHIGLSQRNSAVLNELYATGKEGLLYWPGLFFRALSAVLFQNSVVAGIIISIGIAIHSRIHFSLLVIAFVTACLFNSLTGTYPEGISYYHLGSNIIMASAAMGCFFIIPSGRSYLWAIATVPLTILFINGFTRLLGVFDLPVLSLPLCVVSFLLLYFLRLRISPGKLVLTPLQHYAPERNLYQYLNTSERLHDLYYFKFSLPFMGSWTVSQGYKGGITHKGDWAQALDFVIKDEEGQTYKVPGTDKADYYCFNKPVLACGDGVVEEAVSHIEDNLIGQVNTADNWGNTVVIKHAPGLYSKISHLKKNSVKVKPGDFVKRGDLLGMVGNSGRSPEPHLHFQVQTTPYIGSKTLAYPFAYYLQADGPGTKLESFAVPGEGAVISPVAVNNAIKQAFSFQPGYATTLLAKGLEPEALEVFTDEYNQSYIYSKTRGATAYFINNGTSFYFTSFYGDKGSLLYAFYLAAYKVMFVTEPAITVKDVYPLQLAPGKYVLWLHDIIAPFYRFVKLRFESAFITGEAQVTIRSKQFKKGFGGERQTMEAFINFEGNEIKTFTVDNKGKRVEAQWVKENMY
jgi:urea transporter/murein DD-endopeptidase MepM/ murein hydrolase activator NlpD